ncbi:MAG: hypothetical protein R3F61_04960 [Myxococcota bacterium]
MPPGQDSGHLRGGFDWEAYVDGLVRRLGTLTAVAEHLSAERRHAESIASIERGLRRLRRTDHGDGGVWGRRTLAAFGLPRAVVDRVRWMGLYHSRFTDLPVPVASDLLRLWDRPPVRGSVAGAYVDLGLASTALRGGDPERAEQHLARIGRHAPLEAVVERALVQAFLWSRTDDARSLAALEEAEPLLGSPALSEHSRACMTARWIDQQAWRLNRGRAGAPDHYGALALYARLPSDGPAFARCRRHNGLGWTLHRMGRTAEAREHARSAVETAGDAGLLRLRAMALRLLAVVSDGPEAERARERSAHIAVELDDRILRDRFERPEIPASAVQGPLPS